MKGIDKAIKMADAVNVDIDKLADYLWLWADTRAIGNPASSLLNSLMDESDAKTREEAHAYAKAHYKKELDAIYSKLKSAVDRRLKEGYNNIDKAFQSLR